MVAAVGFKRMYIRVNDGQATKINKNAFIIEGKKNQGGTISAKLKLPSAEFIENYASDTTYHISSDTNGAAEVDVELMDMPELAVYNTQGLVKDEQTGIVWYGNNVIPECNVVLETKDIRGNTVLFGIANGKFSYEGIDLKTLGKKGAELEGEKAKYVGGFTPNNEPLAKLCESDQGKVLGFLKTFGMVEETSGNATKTAGK